MDGERESDAEPLEPARIAELLAATPWIVVAEVGALGVGLAGWRPAPGEWCANEVVGHLIEAERRGFAGRIQAILAADRPVLETWDQPAIAAARRDCERDVTELIAEFLEAREASLRLVRALSTADLERVGLHPAVGELSVGGILAQWVHHDRNHVRQILAIAQARVWGQLGNTRRFTDPTT